MVLINLIGTESVVMEPNTNTKDDPDVSRRTRRLPYEYICIEPNEAPHVIDWLNSAGVAGDREVAEGHLRLCFRCQETVVDRMQIDEEFKLRVRRCLHPTRNDEESVALVHEGVGQSHDDHDGTNPSKSMKAGGQG